MIQTDGSETWRRRQGHIDVYVAHNNNSEGKAYGIFNSPLKPHYEYRNNGIHYRN